MEPPWKAYNIMKKMDYPYEVSGTSISSIIEPKQLHYLSVMSEEVFNLTDHVWCTIMGKEHV